MPRTRNTYRFELDTPCDDETDALILADSLEACVKEERGNPDEPVEIRFRPLEGPDVPDG